MAGAVFFWPSHPSAAYGGGFKIVLRLRFAAGSIMPTPKGYWSGVRNEATSEFTWFIEVVLPKVG